MCGKQGLSDVISSSELFPQYLSTVKKIDWPISKLTSGIPLISTKLQKVGLNWRPIIYGIEVVKVQTKSDWLKSQPIRTLQDITFCDL